MFIASRLQKNSIERARCTGQPNVFGQRSATCPSSRTSGVPHDGHTVGSSTSTRSAPRSTTVMTYGMISPAFSISTRSPTATSSRLIWLELKNEARLTVVPDSSTGSKWPSGVMAPVRPTFRSTSQQLRRRLLGRELVGDGPARRARWSRRAARRCGMASTLMTSAVDGVGQLESSCRLAQPATYASSSSSEVTRATSRRHRQPERLHPRQELEVRAPARSSPTTS